MDVSCTDLWSSLMTNSKLVSKLSSLNSLQDSEEKVFALLTRMTFLLAMGMKQDRDTESQKHKNVVDQISQCLREKHCSPSCKLFPKIDQIINEGKSSALDENSSKETIPESPRCNLDSVRNMSVCSNSVDYGETNIFDQSQFQDMDCVDLSTPVKTEPQSPAPENSPSLLDRTCTNLFSPSKGFIDPKTQFSEKTSQKTLNMEQISASKLKKDPQNKSLGVKTGKPKQSTLVSFNMCGLSSPVDAAKVLDQLEKVDPKEKEELRRAMKVSLSTAQCEQMIRSKTQQLKEKKISSPKAQRSSKKRSHCDVLSENLLSKDHLDANQRSPMKRAKTTDGSVWNKRSPPSKKENIRNVVGQKIVSQPKTELHLMDSFDVVTNMAEAGPSYAHKGDTVRKKHERQQLEGWSCHECKQYYESRNLTHSQRKEAMNKCSKHRSKHHVITNTPRNFWNPDWDTEMDT